MADSNRTALYYVPEATWGTTPTTSDDPLQALRITGESFGFNVESITSAEFRSDRMVTDLIQTGANPSGGFNFELSAGAFDELLEGAMWSDWTVGTVTAASTLTNGTTEKSYTFVRVHEDVLSSTDPLTFAFRGMVCNSFNLTVSANSVLSGSFDYIGYTSYATYGLGSGGNKMGYSLTTYTAAPTNDVMNAVTDITTSTIFFDDSGTAFSSMASLSGVFVQDLSFSIANNVRGLTAVGVLGNADIGVGNFDLTGNFTAYLANKDLYSNFIDQDAKSFAFTVNDGNQTYTFYFPKVKFEADSINASGANSDIMENLTWRALYDSTAECAMQIYRSARS